jgi:hypothetical protein
MDRWIKKNMGRWFKIPLVRGLIYHGYGVLYTMGRGFDMP